MSNARRFEQTVKHNRGHSRQGTREQRVSEAGHQRDSVRDDPQREVLSDGVLVTGIGYLVRVHPVLRHRGEDSIHRDSQGIKPRGVIAARDANDQDRYEPLGQKIRERPRGIPQHIPLHRQGLLLAAHMILQLLSIIESPKSQQMHTGRTPSYDTISYETIAGRAWRSAENLREQHR